MDQVTLSENVQATEEAFPQLWRADWPPDNSVVLCCFWLATCILTHQNQVFLNAVLRDLVSTSYPKLLKTRLYYKAVCPAFSLNTAEWLWHGPCGLQVLTCPALPTYLFLCVSFPHYIKHKLKGSCFFPPAPKAILSHCESSVFKIHKQIPVRSLTRCWEL